MSLPVNWRAVRWWALRCNAKCRTPKKKGDDANLLAELRVCTAKAGDDLIAQAVDKLIEELRKYAKQGRFKYEVWSKEINAESSISMELVFKEFLRKHPQFAPHMTLNDSGMGVKVNIGGK